MWGIMQMYGKFAGFHFEQCILWVGNTMDPCWNIYVDFWASSSQLVFSESVCDSMWNIYQYFAVFQKWPNRCLPQKVFGVLGPEFQSSPFFFGRYFLSTPPPTTNRSTKSGSCNSMVFHGVAQDLWPIFRRDLSPRNFWSLRWWKGLGFKNGPKKMAPKMKQTFEFQVKCPEWFGAKGLSDIISQECWVQMRVFLFPFGILLLDEDLMIFQGSWIPAGKKVQRTSQPRLSVHNLGGPVSYTITINMRFCLLMFFWGILNSLEIWKLNPSLISSPPFFLCNPLPKTKKQVKSIQWCLCKNNVYGDIWRENLVKRKM